MIADRQFLRLTRDRLTICRRDVAKLIAAAFEEQIPGDWGAILDMYRNLVERIPRIPTVKNLFPILDEMTMLRSEIINLLEIRIKTEKIDASESQIERHKQNSKLNYNYESEPRIEISRLVPPPVDPKRENDTAERKEFRDSHSKDWNPAAKSPQSFPLGLVLQACPQIADYGPGGRIDTWRDLMAAAVVVRMMLKVSSSAHEEACLAMGPENAATVIACILERGGHINSAGGYLRDLTRRTERGEFAIGPMLMALVRSRASGERRAGSA